MRGEKCHVIGNGPLGALPTDREMGKVTPGKLGSLPCDGGEIWRRREQLPHHRRAPRVDHDKSVFILGRREGAAISNAAALGVLKRVLPVKASAQIPRQGLGIPPASRRDILSLEFFPVSVAAGVRFRARRRFSLGVNGVAGFRKSANCSTMPLACVMWSKPLHGWVRAGAEVSTFPSACI